MEESGLAFITIKEARNLAITEPTDVYCVISLDGQLVKTSECKVTPGLAAEWFEGYTFDTTTEVVSFSLVVWGLSKSVPAGKKLGEFVMPSLTHTGNEQCVRLTDSSGRPIQAELTFKAHCSPKNGKKIGFDDFLMLKVIGKGSFGKVMLVKKKDTNRLYAMKVMRKDRLYREAAVSVPLTERDVLKKYNHPFVVHLKYAFQTETHLYMVMDYLSGGDLFDLMEKRNTLDEDTVRFYIAQAVLAISFLHEHDIIYRDLKPENLLIDMNGNLCLVDFGLCKEGMLEDSVTHTFCGSLQYMAPEVLKGEGYGKTVDWWALGVMAYEMLTGVHPFMQSRSAGTFTDKEVIHGIVHEPLQFSSRVQCLSKASIKFLQNVLQKDPTKRLGVGSKGHEDIKNHQFFAGIDWKKLAKKELLPPFKPHLSDSSGEKKDPWANEGNTGSPVFEFLNETEQEYFEDFSYVSPMELARSRSSPVVRFLHLAERNSGNFSSSPTASPRRRMVKSPGFSGLASMAEVIDDTGDEAAEPAGKFGSLRRQRRRWSLSNFRVSVNEDTPDDSQDGTSSDESPPGSVYVKSEDAHEGGDSTHEGKKKVKGKSFLKSIFGKTKP